MSRHYSTNDFLSHAPVKLLPRYFKERGLLPEATITPWSHYCRGLG